MDEQPRLSRRQLLILSGQLGLAAAALAACGAPQAPAGGTGSGASQGGAAEPAQASGEIEFLAWGDAADIAAWEALNAAFAARNPNVKVNVTTVADPNVNFYPKLQTAIAGGTPPALSSFQGWEWQIYADRDLLAPIDDRIAGAGLTPVYDDSVAAIEGTTKRNGARYLVPLQLATMLMYYSKAAFDEAGIPYPTDDWTFEEFLEIAKQLTRLDGDQKRYGYQANGQWFRDIHWIRSTGKQEFDSLIDPKVAQFNQPEIVEMVQMVAQDFMFSLNISPLQADVATGANTIETGGAAMKYEGPWWLGRMNSPQLRAEGKQIEFDVVLMPAGAASDRPHRGWSEGVALLKGEKVDAAWAFASFMAGEEGQRIYSDTTGRMPNTMALIESYWVPKAQEQFQFSNAAAFIEAFRRGHVDVIGRVPRSKMWSEVVKPVAWDPLLNGSAKAADVLPQVDAALQKLLDEANA
ncbi:MAG: ABC transporter substrate-binding protein [Chloroflexi bacterium OHK40]